MKTIIFAWACGQPVIIEQRPIITYAPIKPYAMQLERIELPERPRPPITFDAGKPGPGPLVIENPYVTPAFQE